jgi:hypothetical protein
VHSPVAPDLTAIYYFHRNAEATVYQMKSKHGYAHIQIEKETIRTRRMTYGGPRKGKLLKRHDKDLASWAHAIFF